MAEVAALTGQEMKVITFMAHGLTADEVAGHLELAPATVKVHLRAVYQKLHVRNRVEAFVRLGWLTPPELEPRATLPRP